MNGFNLHRRLGERPVRATSQHSREISRTIGRTRTGSSSRISSSPRCTGRRCPSISTPSPRSPTASSTTRSTTDTPGNYCDDDTEITKRFPTRRSREDDGAHHAARGEHHEERPEQIDRIAQYWGSIRTCFNIPVLPDQLEAEGHQLEVLRERGRVDERAAGGPARALRADVGQGAGRPRRSCRTCRRGELPAVSWLVPPRAPTSTRATGRAAARARTGPSSRSTR